MKSMYFLVLSSLVIASVLGGEPKRLRDHEISSRAQDIVPQTKKYNATHRVIVNIPNPSDVKQIARENGFMLKKTLTGVLQGYYIFERHRTLRDEPHSLEEAGQVQWWKEEQGQDRVKRSIADREEEPRRLAKRPDPIVQNERTTMHWSLPSDPLFQDQWHLGGSSFSSSINLNVIPAWRSGYTGNGIVIAVVDDGLQRSHPDLATNYDAQFSHDFNDDDNDPSPANGDSHGTSASGVAAAGRDTHCGVGVAYGARLGGYQLLKGWTSDATEAEALSHLCLGKNQKLDLSNSNDNDDNNGTAVHVLSCSWGPTDDAKHLVAPGPITKHVLKSCAEQGRGGKGVIYAWAGGNGRYSMDNSNYDGYANSIYTISVAAVDHYGIVTWYSEPGANIHCAAPSSGTQLGIVTTDLKGKKGYSGNDCTFDFGGTSAAAPQIAGVSALILDANINLSYRDVQDVLALTSKDPHHPQNDAFVKNAAGFSHSHDLGFGVADAAAATQEASRRTEDNLLGPQVHFSTGWLNAPMSQVDPRYTLVLYWEPDNILMASRAISRLEHVTISVKMDTPGGAKCFYLGLIGPSGVHSELSTTSKNLAHSIDWTYMSVRHWGESLVYNATQDVRVDAEKVDQPDTENPSRWKLQFGNVCRGYPMTIKKWRLDFYGTNE